MSDAAGQAQRSFAGAAAAPAQKPLLAEVIVDVATAGTDSVFHYVVPPALKDQIRIGHRVRVPFGPRAVQGCVVGFADHTDIPRSRLRELKELIDPEDPLPAELLALTEWLAERYLCLRVQALRCIMPPGARRESVRSRQIRVVLPNRPQAELAEAVTALEKRAPRQAALLRVMAFEPGGMPTGTALRRAQANHGSLNALCERGLLKVEQRESPRDPLLGREIAGVPPHPPTPEQQECLAKIEAAIEEGSHRPFLLHGITGSGKTEIYLHAIRRCLEKDRTAICLVPEISLTPQLVGRFRAAFGDRVALLHSALSDGERYDEWRRIQSGRATVVVGARSAVFAPVRRLGLIVIDEEHEPAYKQEETPRYHAREVALERARLAGAVLVCGSATPALETLHRVAAGGSWQKLVLPHRVEGRPLPVIRLVDQRREFGAGYRSLFSRPLTEAMAECLGAGRQAILFLNRRGFATIVLCRECGHAVRCPHCAVALTFHREGASLACHYCDHRQEPPAACPACSGVDVGYFGAGTERVERLARRQWPDARILRMDADTTSRKGSHQRVYQAFLEGRVDILIGTQMIAKGWDIPGVSLVGVISADTSLHLPDFRSSERTYQLLVQVSGRAGRGAVPGQVIVQTFNPDHPAVEAARTGDETAFYEGEMAVREALSYPPFGHMIRILAAGAAEPEVQRTVEGLAAALTADLPAGSEILGPAQAPLARLRGKFRWHLLIKGPDPDRLRQHVRRVLNAAGGRVPNTVRLGVDVDPQALL